jgi:hypothetical protein
MPDGVVVQVDGYDWGREVMPITEWLTLWVDGRPDRREHRRRPLGAGDARQGALAGIS